MKDLRVNRVLLGKVIDLHISLHSLNILFGLAFEAILCTILALIYRDCNYIKTIEKPISFDVDVVSVAKTGRFASETEDVGSLLFLGRAPNDLTGGVPFPNLSLIDPVDVDLEVVIVDQVDDLIRGCVFGPQPQIERGVVLTQVDNAFFI